MGFSAYGPNGSIIVGKKGSLLRHIEYGDWMLISDASYSVKSISDHVNGTVIGNPELIIQGLCTLDAPQPNHITFIRAKGVLALARALKSLKN